MTIRGQLLSSVSTKGMATMDLAAYLRKQNEGVIVNLKNADGTPWLKPDGSPATITVAGNESKHWRKAESEIASERLNSDTGKDMPWEERRLLAPRMLAYVTMSWDGLMDPWDGVGDKPLECNRTNATRLYADFDFIRTQVDTAVGSRKNFMTAS
jgi:hypothetical protein